MLNLASKFGKVEGYIFLSMCAKIQIKTPRIAPKKTHYSSSRLWGKHVELRGGSLSVWDSHADLRRFIRWPVHVAIMNNWRGRIRVRSASWDDERFVPLQAWLRAEASMRTPRDM